MDLLAAWLLYPLAVAATCLGLGLLAERAAAWRMPGTLLVPAGFAALLVLARLATSTAATARLALPLIAVLAVGGLVAGRARLRAPRPDRWLLAGALGVFAVFGAPVVLSGTPTLAGYLALPDTGHHLALAELFAHHGPDWMALRPQSSIAESVAPFVIAHYPVSAQAALGVTAPLGIVDMAWLYQPLLTVMAVVLFLTLASVVARLLARRWQAAVVAFVAAQPALVTSFALQGSIKELAALAMLATAVALVVAAVRERRPARSLLPAALAAAAALGAIGPAALAYLAVPALAALGVWGRRVVRERRTGELAWLAAVAAVAVVAALPAVTSLDTQVRGGAATLDAGADRALPNSGGDLGNLAAPLQTAQALGVWLSGDYRYPPDKLAGAQDVAFWVAGALALLGLGWALHRRAWGPLLLLCAFAIPSAYLLARGSPYADAKILMIASPAIVLLAMLGCAGIWTGRWRALSLTALTALTGGVLASNALAYHDVSLLPHDRYAELLTLNDRLAGRGLALVNEYDEFAKYFLARVPASNEPESDHVYRRRPYEPDALHDPRRRPSLKTPLDMDDLTLRYVESFPYVILRRSPTASRPPASFRRVWRGEHYELWRRAATPRVLSHEPLGRDVLTPAARVSEATARAWAARARRLGGRIAFVRRGRLAVFSPTRVPHPGQWFGLGNYPDALVTDGPGRIDAPVAVPRTGRYHVSAEGSFARRLTLRVDGRTIGRTPVGLENPGAYASFATIRLRRGGHRIEIVQGGGDLRPGSGGYRSSLRHLGPIVLQPAGDAAGVSELAPRDWRALVGVRADWLEVVRP